MRNSDRYVRCRFLGPHFGNGMPIGFHREPRDPTRVEARGADYDIDLVFVTLTVDESGRGDLLHLFRKHFDVILREGF